MMHQNQQQKLHHARIIASVAATLMSLACGTNVGPYTISIMNFGLSWAPQFAERLKLSSTESNLIGLAGNLGQYTMGVPIGIFVDHRGPRPAVLAGAVLLAVGYFPLHQAYDRASGSVPLLCVFSYMTGLGGCMAFAAAVKTSALNWPQHRGTATAFPLAAFGLSAFFFSLLGSLFFPGDPSAFLELLAWGTFGITLGSFFFLKVHHQSTYEAVPDSDDNRSLPSTSSQHFRQGSSDEPKVHRPARAVAEPGMFTNSSSNSTRTSTSSYTPAVASSSEPTPDPTASPGIPPEPESGRVVALETPEDLEAGETSPLTSRPSSRAGDTLLGTYDINNDRSHRVDIRGLALMRSLSFWQLFTIMGILAGVGLMTINNIGNDAKALWKHYDKKVTDEFLIHRQQMHVSTLSICSFLGRLLSGVGSDFLVNRLHASRLWCLVVACAVFFLAQVCALSIENPHLLGLVSGLSGIAYGFLFGVSPSIVAEGFGIRGLSQNWGFLTMAPVISSNIFNIFYGKVYDRHSIVEPDGERSCLEGLECYRSAYWVTLFACIAGTGITMWGIRHQRAKHLRENDKGEEED
ncbi:mch1 monocarboxylate permease not transporting monocarboxylate [Fusarium albosuccineum]|uniref:Mch1 monocarboxylate permease not transporting monocarboxylate n=1 Tax=Fusarium albosuccineum TaxID=1237068 RepID=A0A8H4LB34_9HYPO|nr:mch1 monocarboxylate permease not transporting monocarboxylate [Fusarium albosuccineum]